MRGEDIERGVYLKGRLLKGEIYSEGVMRSGGGRE